MAQVGSGTTVLVAGEAGIGKTRLASELAARARNAGFEVLLGRSIDLVGTELPYQPFVEALRPLGERWQATATAGSQRQAFEETLALLTERAAAAPVLLVLEDLHWADTSTLDLVVFLAHNVADRRWCCSRPTAPTSPPRPSACAGSPTASGARARRSCSSSGRSRARVDHTARGSHRRLPARGRHGHDHRPFRRQSVLRRGTPRRRRCRQRQPSSRPARSAAGASRATRPGDPGPVASGCRRRRRRRCTRCSRNRALPDRDGRESLRRAIEHGVLVVDQADGQLPLPPRAAGGGGLRDDPSR